MCFFIDLILFLARSLFAFVFAYHGIDQLLNWNRSLEFFKDLPSSTASLLLVAGLALQFFGAFSLFFGVKTRLGAFALILYVIGVAVWPVSPLTLAESGNEAALLSLLQHALSVAGLLYVFAIGSGRWSCDWLCGSRSCKDRCSYSHKETSPQPSETPKT